MANENFNDKTVWITGATSGIGLELSKQFAARGARVVISARRQDVLEEVKASLPGDNHVAAPLDLANPEALIPQAESYLAEIGQVDILVNNGGISQREKFLDTDFDVYRRLIEVNYLGTVALTKVVLPQMIERGSGAVGSVASIAGLIGNQLRTGYSGSKFAVVGFMEALRAETAQYNIHCMEICPGSIKTNIARNALLGGGIAQGSSDPAIENGYPVESCAREIIEGFEKRKDQIIVGQGKEMLAPYIKRFFPKRMRKLLAITEHR